MHSTDTVLTNTEPALVFNEPHSPAIRIWHWTFFLALTASLMTVLFGSTLFRTRNNISLVQQQLQEKGVTVTPDQARAVAHEYSDKLWDLHTLIGYILCVLLLSRILIEITQPSEEKLSLKIKKALGLRSGIPGDRKEHRHYVRVKTGYLLFYLFVLMMALTGLGLAFEDQPFLKANHKLIKQIHVLTQWAIYAYVLLHLIGVVAADLGRHKGLISGMIHGKKQKI